jgi:hypothetical protein
LGLRDAATGASTLFLPISTPPTSHGIWIALVDDGAIGPANSLEAQLVWVDSTGVSTQLAAWDWDSWDPTEGGVVLNPLDVQLNLTDVSYDLSFSETIANLSGSLVGALPGAAPTSVRVGAFEQRLSTDSVPSFLNLDRITIVAPVPEPSTITLLAISLLGFIVGRRKRRRHV